jgi:Putative auto-transporter adhesin, head GIN domain
MSLSTKKINFMRSICIALIAWIIMPAISKAQDEKVIVNDPLAQQRTVGSFSEISVSGGIDLYLSPDNKETVVVSAKEEQYRDRIVTRITGNKLEIFFNDKGKMRWPDMRLKVYVSFRQLNKLTASGSSDVFVNGVIKSDNLEIKLSGASDFSAAVDVNNLRLDQSGSSDSKISGRAIYLDIEVSGASDMKAFDLQTDTCNARASGASDIQITVNKEISAEASGSSDISYRGGGSTKNIRTSGSSSVKRNG